MIKIRKRKVFFENEESDQEEEEEDKKGNTNINYCEIPNNKLYKSLLDDSAWLCLYLQSIRDILNPLKIVKFKFNPKLKQKTNNNNNILLDQSSILKHPLFLLSFGSGNAKPETRKSKFKKRNLGFKFKSSQLTTGHQFFYCYWCILDFISSEKNKLVISDLNFNDFIFNNGIVFRYHLLKKHHDTFFHECKDALNCSNLKKTVYDKSHTNFKPMLRCPVGSCDCYLNSVENLTDHFIRRHPQYIIFNISQKSPKTYHTIVNTLKELLSKLFTNVIYL